jgi:hypothetical protein
MDKNFFYFEGTYYDFNKLVTYTSLSPWYYRIHGSDDYYVYYYKRLQFMGDIKLELKSKEFKVPKYIESDEFETVKFLWFTFKRRKKIINPAWEIIADDKTHPLLWEEIIAKETGKDVKDVTNLDLCEHMAEKTGTTEMYQKILKRAKILTEIMNETKNEKFD